MCVCDLVSNERIACLVLKSKVPYDSSLVFVTLRKGWMDTCDESRRAPPLTPPQERHVRKLCCRCNKFSFFTRTNMLNFSNLNFQEQFEFHLFNTHALHDVRGFCARVALCCSLNDRSFHSSELRCEPINLGHSFLGCSWALFKARDAFHIQSGKNFCGSTGTNNGVPLGAFFP